MAGSEPFLSDSWYRVAGLRPRLSDQVSIRMHRYRGKPWYVLSDGVSGRVHRLTPAALGIVAAMDGRTSLDQIWHEAARRSEDAPTQDQVLQLLAQLHTTDLLRADVPPDTRELLERAAADEWQKWKGLLNPLSLRFGLFNPDWFIRRTLPIASPLFTIWGLFAWAGLVGFALVLAWQNWTGLTAGVGDRVLAADNLVLLGLCLPATKALHEFGHGYAARRFGAAVPEMGVMFLMFLPMPYVDASAAAAFPVRWRRILVGAAGMMVELALAAGAMLVWVSVEPGFLRSLAYNVMFAASVTTVLFNGNPLMRYDGYHILADLLEIPNLGQRATRFWTYLLNRYLFGVPDLPSARATLAERMWFLLYAPLSTIYRLTVTLGIAFFLAERYWAVGAALGIWSVTSAIVIPLGKACFYMLRSPTLSPVRARAVGFTVAGLAMASAALLLVPAPHHTLAEGVVWLPETAMVRAGADGFVELVLAAPGQPVGVATPIVQSVDPAVMSRRHGLQGRVAELKARWASERIAHLVDAQVTETELEQAEAELAQVEVRVSRLVARSNGAGLLSVPQAIDLAGRFVREGELVAYVLPPVGSRVVRVIVPQDDIDLVRNHLRGAELYLVGHPEAAFPSEMLREVPAGRDSLSSKALGSAGGGAVPIDPRDNKGLRTLHRTFEFDFALPVAAPGDAFGSRVYVRLDHDWEPVAEQLYRRVRQTLLSRLQA